MPLRTAISVLFHLLTFPLLLFLFLMIVALHLSATLAAVPLTAVTVESLSVPIGSRPTQQQQMAHQLGQQWHVSSAEDSLSLSNSNSQLFNFYDDDGSPPPKIPASIEDPHLFTNYVLTFDKQNDAKATSGHDHKEGGGGELKRWLTSKLNKFISIEDDDSKDNVEDHQTNNHKRHHLDEEEENSTLMPIGSKPSSNAPNEIQLPIDFNLLIPSSSKSHKDNNSLLSSSSLFSALKHSKIMDVEHEGEGEEDFGHEPELGFNEMLSQGAHDEMSSEDLMSLASESRDAHGHHSDKDEDSVDFNQNSLDFVQQLIRSRSATESESTTTMPTLISSTQPSSTTSTTPRTTTSTTTVASTPSSHKSVSNLLRTKLKSSQAVVASYRNISFDRPERRVLLMSYPIRKMLMAYFAPRILRFQAAMLLNSVIGEVSRKILDPFIGNHFGGGGGGVGGLISQITGGGGSSPQPRPSASSSPLSAADSAASLSQLAQLASSLSASAGSLPPSLQQLQLPPSVMAKQSQQAQMTAILQQQQTNPTIQPQQAVVASQSQPYPILVAGSQQPIMAAQPGVQLQITPQSMQALFQSLNESDQMKQLLGLAGSTILGGTGGSGTSGQAAANAAAAAASQSMSLVYEPNLSEQSHQHHPHHNHHQQQQQQVSTTDDQTENDDRGSNEELSPS